MLVIQTLYYYIEESNAFGKLELANQCNYMALARAPGLLLNR